MKPWMRSVRALWLFGLGYGAVVAVTVLVALSGSLTVEAARAITSGPLLALIGGSLVIAGDSRR